MDVDGGQDPEASEIKVRERLAQAFVLAFAVIPAAPLATASAAPVLSIESAANGSFTLNPPVIRGTTDEPGRVVTVRLESAGKAVGAPFYADPTAGGHW